MSGQVPRPGELPPLPTVRPPKDAPAPRPDPLVGTIIGDRYRLIERIGVGGMATVYRAEHQLLRKSVAVKLLLPELVGEGDLAARFEREAVAAARLDHPNVVSITDFGRTTDGQMFLVMEFLEGTPLDELIDMHGRDGQEGGLPWERAVEITRQILRGLAHAHDAGVVHRDLKPSNIMVTSHTGGREVAKIIDFGIAKIVGGSPIGPHVETQAGIIFGTADFLAPERLLGRGDSDPRSDLYSVGVILYEMLAGERPFYDPDPYLVVKRAVAEIPQAPSTFAPDCPAVLDDIVLRALAKEPEQRHGSAREMLAVLDPLARRGSSAVIAVPVPVPVPPAKVAVADMSFSPMANASTPPGGLSSRSPLPLFEPKPPKRARWIVPAIGVAAAFCVVVAIRGGAGGPTVVPVAATASTSKDGAPDSAVEKLITKAAEGETVADRQSAFDRLVAFGYLDRVPWVPMLGKDLAQLPTCEERKATLEKLRKVNDSSAIPYIQEALGRADNACLADDAQKAMAGLRASGAPPDSSSKKKAPSRSSGGGGHF